MRLLSTRLPFYLEVTAFCLLPLHLKIIDFFHKLNCLNTPKSGLPVPLDILSKQFGPRLGSTNVGPGLDRNRLTLYQ